MSRPWYLPPGLPRPTPRSDGLDRPYWEGLRAHRLLLQCCDACGRWQHGPEWICHRCHSFHLSWQEVAQDGVMHSFARVWHPSHPALRQRGCYMLGVISLPGAGGIRVVGNLLLGEAEPPAIGLRMRGNFEDHDEAPEPYTLLHWTPASPR